MTISINELALNISSTLYHRHIVINVTIIVKIIFVIHFIHIFDINGGTWNFYSQRSSTTVNLSMSGDRSSTGKITLASLALLFSKSFWIDGQNKSKGTVKDCITAIASRCHRSAKWSDDLTNKGFGTIGPSSFFCRTAGNTDFHVDPQAHASEGLLWKFWKPLDS